MWDIIGGLLRILTSLVPPLTLAFRVSVERPSTQIIKKYGESGSPCFKPLIGMIGAEALALKSTE